MSKKKKKIKNETLSKKEIEIKRIYLENNRGLFKERKIKYIDYYKNIIDEYILAIEDVLQNTKKEFEESLVELYQFKIIEDMNQLSSYIKNYELVNGIYNYFKEAVEVFILDLKKDIENKIILGDIEEAKETLKTECNASDRVIEILEEEINELFRKTKNQTFKHSEKYINSLINDFIEHEKGEMNYYKDINDNVNEYLKTIQYKNKTIKEVQFEIDENICSVSINNKNVKSKQLILIVSQYINENLGTSELKEDLELNLKGGLKAVNDNKALVFTDGRKIKWGTNGLIVDTKVLADKCYSHKELNKYAKDKGYKVDRINGDHAIYTKEGFNPIVIPQRTIGRGLQQKILRDLDIV